MGGGHFGGPASNTCIHHMFGAIDLISPPSCFARYIEGVESRRGMYLAGVQHDLFAGGRLTVLLLAATRSKERR